MLLVGDDSGAGEVEVVLVELCLVGVGDKVTIDTRLQLEGIGVDQGVGCILELGEIDGAQAGQITSVASNSGRDVADTC